VFRFLVRKLRQIASSGPGVPNSDQGQKTGARVGRNLEVNIRTIQEAFGDSRDLIIRRVHISPLGLDAAVLFLEGMVDARLVSAALIEPLLSTHHGSSARAGTSAIDTIERRLVSVANTRRTYLVREMLGAILSGEALLLLDGIEQALMANVRGWQARAITEATSDVVFKGPRDGFVETLQTNIALLRRRIKNQDLTFESIVLGQRTRTPVAIGYIRSLANEELLAELRRRLGRIEIDSVLDSQYVAELISDTPFSPVVSVASTERPDVVASRLLEGRVTVLVDGSPFALTLPSLFAEGFQSAQDYYYSPYFQSFLRIIRYAAFGFNILALPYYIAVTTFHQQLVPTPLLLTIAASKEGTPFPVAFEAAMMLLFFEVLRESSMRTPRALGQTVSIVGALVVGQTAVMAGIVGAPVVIITALTAISSFVVPAHVDSGAIARLLLIILASTTGFYGLAMGLIMMLVHVSSLSSFGVPMLSPVAPLHTGDMKDTPVRSPWWAMDTRPTASQPQDLEREASQPVRRHRAGGD